VRCDDDDFKLAVDKATELAALIQQYQRFSLATFKARQTITEATILF
jgi:hypothetical protein